MIDSDSLFTSTGGTGVTKDRLLDAAERLFAEHGFQATSLRHITADAGVNLAAVNYHFQSKESLILAVLIRKLEPINRRRLELLDELEARQRDSAPSLEGVLRAFLQPVLEAKAAGMELATFPRLLGRIYTEPGAWIEKLIPKVFGEVMGRFKTAFAAALPGAEPVEVAWGIHFAIGSMAHFLAAGKLLELISQGAADESDSAGTLERLVVFTASGMRAMVLRTKEAAG
ncbi:MAG: TetR/AcrR family transcriptional regulator [Candidatus Solibacter usitatus]|nr:TetR/AcrR family transcriptional regulator [Candidatus Solibacter usitatus]